MWFLSFLPIIASPRLLFQAAAIATVLLEEEPEPLGERPVEAEVAAPRVTTLTRGALQEVRRTPRPSPVTVAVLEAVCQLLGHPKPPFANAAAKRAGKKTREWSQIQAIMTSATFLQRVLKYDPMEHLESGELSFDDFVRIEREYIEPIDPAEVTTASMAVVSLYEWAHAAVHIVKHSHDPDFDARLMPQLPRDTKLSFNQHKRIAGASLGRSNSLERAASSGYGLQRQNTPADVSNGGGGGGGGGSGGGEDGGDGADDGEDEGPSTSSPAKSPSLKDGLGDNLGTSI